MDERGAGGDNDRRADHPFALASALAGGPPPAPPGEVVRSRLHDLLGAAADVPLTVVVAPAGYGKTSLLGAWARQAGRSGWLTVEPADQDPGRFWRRLIAAVRRLDPAFGVDAVDLLDTDGPAAPDLVGVLARDLGALGPVAVVLDDLHAVAAAEVLDGLARLVARLPAGCRLLVGSRTVPPLGIPRLRAAGAVTEIAADDLRFTDREAARLLGNLGLAAPGSAVQSLNRRAAGWAVALQLAAIAVGRESDLGRAVEAGGEHERMLTEYLLSEVLARQQPDVRDFLLCTSVLETLDAAVCDAVTGRRDSAAVLRELLGRNLFLTETAPGRYRYHALVADMLAAELRRSDPDRYHRARVAAAEHLAAVAETAAAVRHLVAVGEYDRAFAVAALHLLSRVATFSLDDEVVLPGVLPREYLTGDPTRIYAVALYLLCLWRGDEAEPWLRQLEWGIRRGDYPAELAPHVAALQVVLCTTRADHAGAIEHGRDWQAMPTGALELTGTLRESQPWLPAVAEALRVRIPAAVIRAYALSGQPELARQTYAAAAAADPPLAIREVNDGAALAYAALAEGNLTEAADLLDRALTEADRLGLTDEAPLAARIARAMLRYERNDLAGAEADTHRVATRFESAGLAVGRVTSELQLAEIWFARGEVSQALDAFDQLHSYPVGPEVRCRVWASEARMRTEVGDLDGAAAAVEQLPPELAAPARVRLALARGDVGGARAVLAGWRPPAWSRRDQIVRALLAARCALPDLRAASRPLERAVELARAERFVRTVLDEGPDLRPALRRIVATGAGGYPQWLLAAADAEPARHLPLDRPEVVEPLTSREREVLRHLAAGMSYSQIGDVLNVSRNTLKTHVRMVYRKLGVSSRGEAAEAARSSGVLDLRRPRITPEG